MGIVDDLADKLARDAIEAAEELDDPEFIAEVAKTLGASSTTTEEAFLTSVRVRLAERRARAFLEERMAKVRHEKEKVVEKEKEKRRASKAQNALEAALAGSKKAAKALDEASRDE